VNSIFWNELLPIAMAATELGTRLNAQGWAIMLISVGTVVWMTFYCMYRVLKLPPAELEDIKGPLEIEPRDPEDAI